MFVADSYLGADIYLLTAAFEFIFFWNLPYLDFGFVFTSVVLMLVLMLVLMKVLMLVLKLAPMLVLAGTDAGGTRAFLRVDCHYLNRVRGFSIGSRVSTETSEI